MGVIVSTWLGVVKIVLASVQWRPCPRVGGEQASSRHPPFSTGSAPAPPALLARAASWRTAPFHLSCRRTPLLAPPLLPSRIWGFLCTYWVIGKWFWNCSGNPERDYPHLGGFQVLDNLSSLDLVSQIVNFTGWQGCRQTADKHTGGIPPVQLQSTGRLAVMETWVGGKPHRTMCPCVSTPLLDKYWIGNGESSVLFTITDWLPRWGFL